MNLFDVLSAGKRDLNEENVSSFLAWILNPSQTHGCGCLFLVRLLSAIDNKPRKAWEEIILNSSVDVLVEEEVSISDEIRRYIDVVVVISTCSQGASAQAGLNEKSTVLAIENKIRDGACRDNQLIEQCEGLSKNYCHSDLFFLYLTPNKKANFKNEFSKLPDSITRHHLTWTKQEPCNGSISFVDICREVINDDLHARINPLSNELKFIIKSFVMFAENRFRSIPSKVAHTKRSGNQYFKGTVSGLGGVKQLLNEMFGEPGEDQIYIGFMGGINSLEKETFDRLENRNYKWDDSLVGKQKSNWISIEKFVEIAERAD